MSRNESVAAVYLGYSDIGEFRTYQCSHSFLVVWFKWDLVKPPNIAVFAGQGRLPWHYGVAHSILAGIETTFVAKEGRNWLRDENSALIYMVDGP